MKNKKVNGVVSFVGTKFNGSVKIGNDYYSFARGVNNPCHVGDMVTLTLEPWESNGKNGFNIVGVDILAIPHKSTQKEVSDKHLEKVVGKANEMSKEDWAAKDRRISRQGVIQIAVQVAPTFEKAVELADRMLEYVNKV